MSNVAYGGDAHRVAIGAPKLVAGWGGLESVSFRGRKVIYYKSDRGHVPWRTFGMTLR